MSRCSGGRTSVRARRMGRAVAVAHAVRRGPRVLEWLERRRDRPDGRALFRGDPRRSARRGRVENRRDVDLATAIRAYTFGGAYADHVEDRRRSITPASRPTCSCCRRTCSRLERVPAALLETKVDVGIVDGRIDVGAPGAEPGRGRTVRYIKDAMTAPPSPSEQLRTASDRIWQGLHAHPFITELAAGLCRSTSSGSSSSRTTCTCRTMRGASRWAPRSRATKPSSGTSSRISTRSSTRSSRATASCWTG